MNGIIRNLLWKFAERIGSQLVSLIISTILARILLPSDYGNIALVTVIITILRVFVDSGLFTSLVQKKDADDLDYSTVFYANTVLCVAVYVIIFFLSPYIAAFYSKPDLASIIRVLSLTIVITGFVNVHNAYIAKNMLFKKIFFSTLIGTIISGVIGIVMAKLEYGVWALVGQQLSYAAISSLIIWFSIDWKPSFAFSLSRFRALFGYGSKLLISGLLDTGYGQLRQLIIAKLYSAEDLAFYNKGENYPLLLVSNINSSIDSVLLPSMSNIQDSKEAVKSMMRKSIRNAVYVLAPVLLGLAAVADKLILILLTEKWAESTPYMRIFCITYMFYPIHTSNLNAIKAIGRSDIFLRLEIIKKAFGILLILISMRMSVWAMCLSTLLGTLIGLIVNSWPNHKLLDYNLFEQMKDIAPYILLASAMAVSVYLIGTIKLNIVLLLVIQVIAGAAIYVGGSIIFKFEEFENALDVLRSFIDKIRNR